MSTDLVHIDLDKPEVKAPIIRSKPYLPDSEGFRQLLGNHDHLCFESRLKERLECFVGNVEGDKIDDYHMVCHYIVEGREDIAEFIAVGISSLNIDKDLNKLVNNIVKSNKPAEKEIAYRQFFNVIGNRYKILIVLPNLYESTGSVSAADIMILEEFIRYCKGLKFWICGNGSWDLNHKLEYKVFFRHFDPISLDYFVAMKENRQLPVAYISYRWLGKSLDIVDTICEQFRRHQVYYKRDKEDCQFNDNISDFMKEIRDGRPVVIVFSEAYFKSYACCYELTGIFGHDNYMDRIVGVMVDESLRDNKNYNEIANYWEDKRKENRTDMEDLKSDVEKLKEPYREKEANMLALLEKLHLVIDYLRDDNAMNLGYLESNQYMPVVNKVKEKMMQE